MAYNIDITEQVVQIKSSVIEFEFEFTNIPGIFVKADVKLIQAFESLRTGLLKNNPISRVKLLTITEDKNSVDFVYNVNSAQKGIPPWTLLMSDHQ